MKGLVYYNGLVINIIHLMLCLCIYNITVLKIATVSLCASYFSVNIIMIYLIVKNKIQSCILKSVKLWLCILISFAVLCLLTISIFLDAEQSATTIKGLCLMIVLFWGIYRLIETLFATVFNNEHIPMFFASMAKHGRELKTETLIHSDQGCHYTSHKFTEIVRDSGLRRSMSRRGNCWDNAPQESFFGNMKDEVGIKIQRSESYEETKNIIDDWMDYYNNDRYVWKLSKLSPNEFYDYIITGKYPLPYGD